MDWRMIGGIVNVALGCALMVAAGFMAINFGIL